MGDANLSTRLSRRYGPLMMAATSRVSANNLEMWEHLCNSVPWTVLDRLALCGDDAAAADWLLTRSRTQEMMCVVLGFQKLIDQADAKAARFAQAAVDAASFKEAMVVFCLYWFGLPLGYSRSGHAATSAA